MKRTVLVFTFLIVVGIMIFANASVQDIIITPTQPSTFTIKVWTGRAAGATYYPGDSINVYFRTSHDAYVTIYDYTTSGQIRVIFPNFFQHDNFVRGNVTYVIPNPNYNYNFTVTGPNGREVIEAIASTNRNVLSQPQLGNGNQLFQEIPDGLGYLQKLKLAIVGKPIAVDTTYFYVGYVPTVGTVYFDSQPKGAQLYVDGVYEGITPLNLQLAEGEHLAVFWYGSMNVSKSFNVAANTYQTVSAMITQPQQPYPQNQTFAINFNTSPSGAMIFVNGQMLGISSCLIDLDYGIYQITIVKPGYSTIVTEITINYAQTFNFSLKSLNF